MLALERENDDLKVELRRYKRGLDETRTDIDLENRKVKEMEKLLEDVEDIKYLIFLCLL